ncbi:MAG: EAL domain-containing protein [Solirubrobacteraceae bacterium]
MPRPRWVTWILCAQVAMVAAFVLAIAGALPMLGIGWEPDSWTDFLPVLLAGLPALAARALYAREDRAAWALLATGWALYCGGWLVWDLHFAHQDSPPFPSSADALWMLFYPCVCAAVVLLIRARLPRVTRPMWLDGAVTALATGAFAVAVVLPVVTSHLGGSVAQNLTLLTYPAGDLLALALLAGGLAVWGRRGCRLLWQLAIAFLLLMAADVGYLLLTADATFAPGGPLDLGWPLFAALLTWSAWSGPGALVEPPAARRRAAIVPMLFGGAAAGLLVTAAFVRIEPAAVAMAVVAVVLFGVRAVMAMREASDLRDVHEQSLTDDLTGLLNRRGLRAAIDRLPQTPAGACDGWAIALLDLDGFKEINETLGHRAGDLLLAEIGRRFSRAAGPDAEVARLGGDEFALLAPVRSAHAPELVAALRTALEEPVPADGVLVQLHGSAGLCLTGGCSTEELLRRAEVAMYRAKAERTGWSLYEPAADQHSRDQLQLVSELRQALRDGGEIVAFYQPQVDMATGALRAAEALARWEHPTRGMLSPAVFVPLAERHGLMKQLTLHVVDCALTDCARWRAEGLTFGVSVNVSAVNLVDADLVPDVLAALARHGLPAGVLTLEVTEGDVMADFDRSATTLEQLRALGIGLSIDDFGTGHSSLGRLRSLPADEIKIDRSFVMTMTRDVHDHAIVRAVIDLARRFDKRIVAEGVEDEETWTELRDLGCDVAQGFLMGRPQPLEALLASAAEMSHGRSERSDPVAPERLAAKLAMAPTAKDACGVVVRYLAGRGYDLPSIYLRRGQRLRCQASLGYWQVLDGLPLGTGVIGRCLQEERTLNLDLGVGEDAYLEAASGVGYELAVPVWCDGKAVAVINVEDVNPFGDDAVTELESVAAILGRKLESAGAAGNESLSQQLGRLVERFADATSSADVKELLARAAVELTGMESALVTVRSDGEWHQRSVGSLDDVFARLSAQQLSELTEHVAHGASLIAAGDAEGEGLAQLNDLRHGGVETLVLVALHHLGKNEGLLVLADRGPTPPATERVELLELLAAQATSTLQTLATVERLREEASRDPLTGLGHRGAFRAALDEDALRVAAGEMVAVALIDLDHFKAVNDSEGHLAGDRLLRTVAAQLGGAVRREDGVFRLGGDEFAAILRDADGLDLQETAERLRAAAGHGSVTASVGLAVWTPGESIDELLARADEALYGAKDFGRDAARLA